MSVGFVNSLGRAATADVPSGGTGINTGTTAYAPLCTGTTATGNFQVASTGLSTAGSVLTSNGASALPSWKPAGAVSGGFVLLSTVTVGTQSTIDLFNLFDSSYQSYWIQLIQVRVTSSAPDMWLRYGTGSTPTIKSGSTDYTWARNESNSGSGTVIISNSNGDSRIIIASHVEDVSSDPETSMSGNFYLYNPSSGTLKTFVNFTLSYSNNTTSYSYDSNSSGRSTFTTAVTSLQFLLSASTFASGTVKVYGIV